MLDKQPVMSCPFDSLLSLFVPPQNHLRNKTDVAGCWSAEVNIYYIYIESGKVVDLIL